MNKAKIVLVWPGNCEKEQGMPLAFAYLKSNTDSTKYDIVIIDCALENLDPKGAEFVNRIRQINPEVAGVFSWSFNFPEALTVLKMVKKINSHITTILGGPHATVAAEKVLKNEAIDFVFRGEAEFSFPLFLDELLKPTPDYSKVKGLAYKNKNCECILNEISRINNLDEVKIPDYDAINLDRYIEKGYRYQNSKERCAPILSTRGCPYRCAFCSVPNISGKVVRKHSIEYMVSWIKLLYTKYDIRGFVMIDDNFTFDIQYAKAFCREVIKLGYKDIEFNSPNSVRMQRGDVELWSLMRQAGWRTVCVSPESGSKQTLKSMRKDLEPKEAMRIIKDIKRSGLKVHGFFVIGYPGETKNDLKQTETFVKKCRFDGLSATRFEPMPGSPIYEELIEKKEISEDRIPELFADYGGKIYSTALKDFDLEEYKGVLSDICHVPFYPFRRTVKSILTKSGFFEKMPRVVIKSLKYLVEKIDKLYYLSKRNRG